MKLVTDEMSTSFGDLAQTMFLQKKLASEPEICDVMWNINSTLCENGDGLQRLRGLK